MKKKRVGLGFLRVRRVSEVGTGKKGNVLFFNGYVMFLRHCQGF